MTVIWDQNITVTHTSADGKKNQTGAYDADKGTPVQQTHVRGVELNISIPAFPQSSFMLLNCHPHCPPSGLPCWVWRRRRSPRLWDTSPPRSWGWAVEPWTPAGLAGLTPLVHAVCRSVNHFVLPGHRGRSWSGPAWSWWLHTLWMHNMEIHCQAKQRVSGLTHKRCNPESKNKIYF